MKICFHKDTGELLATSPDFILSEDAADILYEALSNDEFDNVPEVEGDNDHMILYFSSVPHDFQYNVDEMSAITGTTIPPFETWHKEKTLIMTTMTWENLEACYANFEGDFDEAFEALCSQSTPNDFYVDVRENPDDGITTISLTPKAYFNDNGYMFDDHIIIDHILPDDFGNDMEGVWSCDRSVEDVRTDLLARGFEEKTELSDLITESLS